MSSRRRAAFGRKLMVTCDGPGASHGLIAADLLAWLRLLALDGSLARADPAG